MRRVLVVDDSTMIHAMYKHILGQRPDCELVFARHGKEALELIEQKGEPSLVFLDINMPIMSGLECLDHLRARGTVPRVPVVLVSTEGAQDDVDRGLSGGAVEYLRKPFKPEELTAVLTRRLL